MMINTVAGNMHGKWESETKGPGVGQ
jgi:hypothetical protein